MQSAVISALCRQVDPNVIPALINRWPALSPALRRNAVTALLSRVERARPVLAAAESGQIATGDFSPVQMNFLRTHPDGAIRDRAARLFGPYSNAAMGATRSWLAATKLSGRAAYGRQLFIARCANCHAFAGEGNLAGLDLSGIPPDREKLIETIVDPSQQVPPGLQTHLLITSEGEALIGMVRDLNPKTVTFVDVNSVKSILPREYVASDQAQPWSLMPSGLAAGLSLQDMADLLGYLTGTARIY